MTHKIQFIYLGLLHQVYPKKHYNALKLLGPYLGSLKFFHREKINKCDEPYDKTFSNSILTSLVSCVVKLIGFEMYQLWPLY